MATERPASRAMREISIASVVLPVPELPKHHIPRPASRFWSRSWQKSRTRLTTNPSIFVTGGRAKETPRYFAGITESMPRRRAFATIRDRQSHGRATSSGPRIQPEPSQMPSRHGSRSLGGEWIANSGLLRVRKLVAFITDVVDGRSLAGRLLDRSFLAGAVGELRIVLEEDQADGGNGARPGLGEDQLGPAGVLGVGVVVVVAVEEADHVGVLLDRAGFAQVREDRPLVGTLLGCAGELRDGDHGNLELAGQDLQASAELRHLLDSVRPGFVAAHQLDVVDDPHAEAVAAAALLLRLQPAGLGAQLEQTEVGGVVDPERRRLELVAGLDDLGP